MKSRRRLHRNATRIAQIRFLPPVAAGALAAAMVALACLLPGPSSEPASPGAPAADPGPAPAAGPAASSPDAAEAAKPAVAPSPAKPPDPVEGSWGNAEVDAAYLVSGDEGAAVSHVPGVAFTADGRRLLAGTSGGALYLWDAEERKALGRMQCADGEVECLGIRGDGRYAVCGLKAGGLCAVDLQGGETVSRIAGVKARWIEPVPKAAEVSVASGRGVEIRGLPRLELLRRFEDHEKDVAHVAWRADGGAFASVGEDGKLVVRAFPGDRVVHEARVQEPLYAVAFHPAGKRLAYGGRDRKIRQRELDDGRETILPGDQPYWITALGYSPDGKHLAVGDECCDIWVFETDPPKRIFHSKHHEECQPTSVAWSPDGRRFLFGCRPNAHAGRPTKQEEMVLQEARTMPEVRTLDPPIEAKNRAIRERIGSPEHRGLVDEAAGILKRRQEAIAADLEKAGQAARARKVREAIGDEGRRGHAVEALASRDPRAALEAFARDLARGAYGEEEPVYAKGGESEAARFSFHSGDGRNDAAEIGALRVRLRSDLELAGLRSERGVLSGRREEEVRKAAEAIRKGFSVSRWALKK
jgi:hypothetical protein